MKCCFKWTFDFNHTEQLRRIFHFYSSNEVICVSLALSDEKRNKIPKNLIIIPLHLCSNFALNLFTFIPSLLNLNLAQSDALCAAIAWSRSKLTA